jgi:hypothetical protein
MKTYLKILSTICFVFFCELILFHLKMNYWRVIITTSFGVFAYNFIVYPIIDKEFNEKE